MNTKSREYFVRVWIGWLLSPDGGRRWYWRAEAETAEEAGWEALRAAQEMGWCGDVAARMTVMVQGDPEPVEVADFVYVPERERP